MVVVTVGMAVCMLVVGMGVPVIVVRTVVMLMIVARVIMVVMIVAMAAIRAMHMVVIESALFFEFGKLAQNHVAFDA